MKKLRIRSILIKAVILLFAVYLTSCSKSVINARQFSDLTELQNHIESKSSFISSKNLKIKFRTSVNFEGKENKISGRIFLFNDSCIFIQFVSNTLGLEIAQLYFWPDSMLFINKYEKSYLSGSYSELKSICDVNYNLTKSLFSATYYLSDTVLINENNTHYLSDLQIFIVNDSYNINQSKCFVTTQFDTFGNVKKTDYKSYNGNNFRVIYSNFALNFGFPAELNFSTSMKKEKVQLTLFYENVELLKKSEVTYKIPSIRNYARITF